LSLPKLITVDGSTRSGESRKRACEDNYYVYIAAELKIFHYGPIVTSDTPIERYRTN